MTHQPPKWRKPSFILNILAIGILIICVIITLFWARYTQQIIERESKREFRLICSEIGSKINARLHAHAELLRSGAAYLAGSDSVTRQEWSIFCSRSKIRENLPGIQGLGFTMILRPHEMNSFTSKIKNEGFKNFNIKPTNKDIITSILYIEPFNFYALGYDMYTDNKSKLAMELSRDSDKAILSGKTTFFHETKNETQVKTLMFAPVFKNGMQIKTTLERRAAIIGWVYSPYRMEDLMKGILGRWENNIKQNNIRMQIYDENINSASLLLDTRKNDSNDMKNALHVIVSINFSGKLWYIKFTKPTENSMWEHPRVFIVFVSGLIICLLLYLLIIALIAIKNRARILAEKLTKDLRDEKEKFQLILDSSAEAIYGIDKQGYCTFANKTCIKILNYEKEEDLLGKHMHSQIHHTHIDGRPYDIKDCKISNETLKGKGIHVDDEVLWKANGCSFHAEYWSFPLYSNNEISGAVVTFFDITDRQLATKALKDSEQRWQYALEGGSNGVWDWNLETDELFCSWKWKEILGIEEKSFSGGLKEWSSRVHPDDIEKCFAELKLHINGSKPSYSTEYRIKHSNGTYLWVLDRGKIMEYNEEGKPLRMIGTISDISERIKMENSIRESEAKYRAILHTLPDMMFIQNRDGIYIDCYIPETAQKIAEPKLFIGKKIKEVFSTEISNALEAIFVNAIRTKQTQIYEYSIEIEGKSYYFEIRIICYEDDKILSIVRDITDRKDSDLLLDQTRLNYETFFNSIDDFLFVLDMQGNIIHYNNTVTKRLGYDREEILGKSVLMVHPENRRDEAGKIVTEMLKGQAEFCPVPLISKNGTQIPVETRIAIGTWNGQQVLFGVTKDISQIKLSEEKFSKLFYMNPSACGLSDFESGKYLEVNNIFCNLFGYKESEVIGKTAIELGIMTSDARELLIHKTNNDGSVYNIETILKTKNGIKKQVLLSAETFFIQKKRYRFTVVHDITPQKEAELALKRNEIHLLIALNMARLGQWEYDINERLFYFNDAFYNIFDYSFDDIGTYMLTAKQYAERFVYSDDFDIVKDEIALAIETSDSKYTRYLEHRFINSKGDIGYLAVRFQIIKNENNDTIRIYGVIQDITEQKRTNEILQLRESYLTAIIENQPGLVWLKDTENKFLAVNNTFANSCGYEKSEELIGKTDWEIWPEKLAVLYVADDNNVMASRKMRIVEELIADKGQPKWFETYKTPIFDEKGNVIGTTGYSRDITYRKQAEEKIKEANTRLSLATRVGGIGVWDYDILNNKIDWDDQMYALYGLNKDSFAGGFESWAHVLHHDDIERGKEEIQMAIDGTKDFDTEFRVCWPDGSIHSIRAVAIVLRDDKGKAVRMIGTNWDITEHKNIETVLLKAKQEADAANAAKSEFLANMSHEIRTPMNAIIGFSEALYHKLEAKQHKKMIKSVINSGNILLSLLNDILDLSKIEAGRLEIVLQSVDLKSAIQEIMLLFSDKALTKNIDLQCNFAQTFPHTLKLDEIRIKQILFNLIGNAIKFTHIGHVRIESDFSATTQGFGTLKIDIIDTGIGIPESQTDVIFEAFRQQEGQSNRIYGGTGLGLTISKRLVEKMNGLISVRSSIGKGSVFTIIFPNVEIGEAENKKSDIWDENNDIRFKNVSMLIIDDVPTNIESMNELAGSLGIRVFSLTNEAITIENIEKVNPDIILLDMQMPVSNGYELAARLKQEQSTKSIPLIAFTASVLSTKKIESTKNFDGYLFKPVRKVELVSQLKRYFTYTILPTPIADIEMSPKSIINEENIHELSEIIKELEEKFLPQWKLIKDSFIIFKIESFIADLKQFSQNHGLNILIDFTLRVNEDIEILDLDSLKVNLSEFPKIIQKISLLKT